MTLTVVADDGWKLGVHVHAAAGEPRARVIALHAMMVDARSLDRPSGRGLASTLAAAGLEVWRADLRGRGTSGPTPAQGGSWDYDDLVRNDLPALVSAARVDGLPVVVVGHSLGAHVTSAAASEGLPIDALVLLGGNIWMPQLEPSRRRRAAKQALMHAFLGVARLRGRFPSPRLRMGPAEESLPYVRDLARFWFADRWAAQDGTDWMRQLSRFDRPVLSIAGRADRLLAHPVSAERFCAPFPRGSFRVWGDAVWAPDHMALGCDLRSAPLWSEIARWITVQVGSRSGTPGDRGGTSRFGG